MSQVVEHEKPASPRLAHYTAEYQRAIAQARSYAQSFTSIFGKDVPPSYIDLGHFAQLAGRTSGLRRPAMRRVRRTDFPAPAK